jgi:hypothetical protein
MVKSVLFSLLLTATTSSALASDFLSALENIVINGSYNPNYPMQVGYRDAFFAAKVNPGCKAPMASCVPNITVHVSRLKSYGHDSWEMRKVYSYRDLHQNGTVDHVFDHRRKREREASMSDQRRYMEALIQIDKNMR